MNSKLKELLLQLSRVKRSLYIKTLLNGVAYLLIFIGLGGYSLLLAEKAYYLPPMVKIGFLLLLIVVVLTIMVVYILIPILKFSGVIKGVSDTDICEYVVNRYPHVEDKLLNIIEMNKDFDINNSVINASVTQKINQIEDIEFCSVISYKSTRKIMVRTILLFALICLLVVSNSVEISKAKDRLLDYTAHYQPNAPFSFVFNKNTLVVEKGKDLSIDVRVEGEKLPDQLYVNSAGNLFMMKSQGNGRFSYSFNGVNNPFQFVFTDKQYSSRTCKVQVISRPSVLGFSIVIDYPHYTGIKDVRLTNEGNIELPVGTNIEIRGTSIDAKSTMLTWGVDTLVNKNEGDQFVFNKEVVKSVNYGFLLSNEFFKDVKEVDYAVDVIPDFHPSVQVIQMQDSLQLATYYFKGLVEDDYGFSKLLFHVDMGDRDSVFVLPIQKNLLTQEFYYSIDYSMFKELTTSLTSCFEVYDNDGVNGVKSSKSELFNFVFPDINDVVNNENKAFEEIEQLIQNSAELNKRVQEKMESFKKKSIQNNLNEYEKKQMLQSIVNDRQALEESLNSIKEKQDQLNNYLNTFEEKNFELLEKQQQINELVENVFSDELKKLMDEFNELLKDFDQSKFNKLQERVDLSMEDMEKQLDRNLEMLRQMQIERKLNRIADQLEDIAEKERALSEDLPAREQYDEVGEKIKKDEDLFDLLQEELEEVQKLNNELEKPAPLDFENEKKEIKKNFKSIQEDVNNKKKKELQKNMKSNAESLENFAFVLKSMMKSGNQQKMKISVAMLRQILSDLIYCSYEQENIIADSRIFGNSDEELGKVQLAQKKLISNFGIVKDSIYAAGKKVPQIGSIVNKELVETEYQLKIISDYFSEGRISSCRIHFQLVMTSINNLSLILEEIIESIERQMANAMPGDQQCENGEGTGNGMMPSLKEAQESLKSKMEKMIQQMKSGGQGQQMNRQIGQAIQQQEMIQNMLQKMLGDSEVGSESKNILRQVNQMLEENKRDLVQQNISRRLIDRQNLIFNKLLKAENAEMERELDDKRESTAGDDQRRSSPASYFNKKDTTKVGVEDMEYSRLKLKRFYRRKYNEFKKDLNTNSND
ncbi:hypothetical protein EYV94_17405 [Puteibacter caeruleilacunae]|nr:hypothetical protein EYV94_17405 [Puteibacter caeruleilacunae]